jgi:hypothetical protein
MMLWVFMALGRFANWCEPGSLASIFIWHDSLASIFTLYYFQVWFFGLNLSTLICLGLTCQA